jgi:ketopantoate reductase
MTHKISPKGIVGLGALGQALDLILPAPGLMPPPVVLFTVKAFDLKEALIESASRWPEDIAFVTLSNGFIANEIAAATPHLAHRPIRTGMTTIGSSINADHSVSIFKQNSMTAWGPWRHDMSQLNTPTPGELQLLKIFPNGQWHDDMRPLICRKWILNTVLNSMSAAGGLDRNSRLMTLRHEAEALLDEAYELARLLWPKLPDFPSRGEASAHLWYVVHATADNENSMARDCRLGRRTESEYLAGMALDFDGFPKLKAIHQRILML